jgi:cytochrome P450
VVTATQTPFQLTGLAALRCGWQFARDPLVAMCRAYDDYGPFVVVGKALPFVHHPRTVLLGVPLILTVGAAFNRDVLNSNAWRPVSLLPGGPRNSAARRLSENLTRMTGRRHAHYRKLIAPPLRKANVDALGENMIRLVEEHLASWPVGDTIDLVEFMYRLVRDVTIELLFGGDKVLGYSIADLARRVMERKWSASVMSFRVNLPMTPYGQNVREAAVLERNVIEWAETKRGDHNTRDLVSIIVNNPDPDGNPSDSTTIARSIPALLTMTSEACQTTLIWALLLLEQHPQVARDLLAELADVPPALDAIMNLPRLDSVIKETMRLIPAVPLQMRVAEQETALAGFSVPKNSRLVLSAFLTNRMPDIYPEADRFLPERWWRINPTPFEYLAFGGGPRQCPGFQFALNVLKIVLAATVKRYRTALAPDARIDYRIQPALQPTGRVPVTLHAQDGAFAPAPIRGAVRKLVRFPI